MKCKEVQPELLDFIDDRLDSFTRDEMDRHLKICEKCRDDLHELKIVVKNIGLNREEQPSAELRENFNTMLQSELNILATANILKENQPTKTLSLSWASPLWKIAACFFILVSGIAIGVKLKSGNESSSSKQMSELNSEVKGMKEALMFTLLKEESPSQRIKAVNYTEEMPNPNIEVINALINTLNHDKNVNVRLASLYSLSRFSDNPIVIDSMVASLARQTEPLIQVVLINMLAEKKETRAIKPIQDILTSKKTLEEVKDIARKGLKTI
jgi:Putative zinc-finger